MVSANRKRAPRGYRTCRRCNKEYMPSGQTMCRKCMEKRLKKGEKAERAKEEIDRLRKAASPGAVFTRKEGIAVPSAVYPGPGCGFSFDEWFKVTWRALRKSAARQKLKR